MVAREIISMKEVLLKSENMIFHINLIYNCKLWLFHAAHKNTSIKVKLSSVISRVRGQVCNGVWSKCYWSKCAIARSILLGKLFRSASENFADQRTNERFEVRIAVSSELPSRVHPDRLSMKHGGEVSGSLTERRGDTLETFVARAKYRRIDFSPGDNLPVSLVLIFKRLNDFYWRFCIQWDRHG